MSFPLVYLHTSFRFETVSTNVTLESAFSLLWQSHGPTPRLNTSFGGHKYRYRVLPLFQEGLLAPGISPEGRQACLLLGLARPLSFASREKEIVETILREELKAKPWSANVWQRSRHLPRRNHFYQQLEIQLASLQYS